MRVPPAVLLRRVVVESEHVAIWRWFAFSGRMKTRWVCVQQDFESPRW